MGNTPNNNFPYPEATGLVKDGWEDIKDLATSIDTKLGVYGAAGLVKLSTTTFSAVSSVSLPANTFTSTYDNYFLVIRPTNFSAGSGTMNGRLRSAGTDNTTSTYITSGMGYNNGGSNFTYTSGVTTQFIFGGISVGDCTVFPLNINTPFGSNNSYISQTSYGQNHTGGGGAYFYGGSFFNTTSFDSFSFYPSTGTMTGSYSVYGYSK